MVIFHSYVSLPEGTSHSPFAPFHPPTFRILRQPSQPFQLIMTYSVHCINIYIYIYSIYIYTWFHIIPGSGRLFHTIPLYFLNIIYLLFQIETCYYSILLFYTNTIPFYPSHSPGTSPSASPSCRPTVLCCWPAMRCWAAWIPSDSRGCCGCWNNWWNETWECYTSALSDLEN